MRKGIHIQTGIKGMEREYTFNILRKIKPVSIVLFNRDFENINDLLILIQDINNFYLKELKIETPIFAIDQEGGNVVRLRELVYPPSNYAIGTKQDEIFAYYSGAITGSQLYEIGIRWNLAPVLDVLSNTDNQIVMERSFGNDVSVVASMGVNYIMGLQRFGVIATAKHFPGHGSVREDSHEKLPIDIRSYSSIINTIYPFKKAIEAGVKSIMMSHVKYESIDNDYPATLSKQAYNLLRKSLNFSGIIITDSVDMKAITANYTAKEIVKLAFEAGADIIECADPAMSIELYDEIEKIDISSGASNKISSLKISAYTGFKVPEEVMSWYSVSSIKWIREKHFLPSDEVVIIILPMIQLKINEKESFTFRAVKEVVQRLRNLRIPVELISQQQSLDVKGKNIVFIGKNLHIWGGSDIINSLSKSNNCIFLSLGVPVDSGVINEDVGYITSMGTKYENILASFYAIFNFYNP